MYMKMINMRGKQKMKFAITSKGDQKSNTLMHRMRTYLQDFELEYDEDQPDIVISVGGDGTLLYAFHRYSSRLDKTSFVGEVGS